MKGKWINVITKDKSSEIHIGKFIFKSSNCEKLLRIKFYSKLHFVMIMFKIKQDVKKLTQNYDL